MKIRMVHILPVVAVATAGVIFFHQRGAPDPPEVERAKPQSADKPVVPSEIETGRQAHPSLHSGTEADSDLHSTHTTTHQPGTDRNPDRESALERFERQREQLEREQDPARRNRLIDNLAQYVRFDTLGAVEWATGLADPKECRRALEDINHIAPVGIGANIAVDDTGFPRIQETTPLSALAATGKIEPGDHIMGMTDENGFQISFKGMDVHQIDLYLRGAAGSKIQLDMERTDQSGNTTVFAVPVERSMIVAQPPIN